MLSLNEIEQIYKKSPSVWAYWFKEPKQEQSLSNTKDFEKQMSLEKPDMSELKNYRIEKSSFTMLLRLVLWSNKAILINGINLQ